MTTIDPENKNLTPEDTSPVETGIAGSDDLTTEANEHAPEGVETPEEPVLSERDRILFDTVPTPRGTKKNLGEGWLIAIVVAVVFVLSAAGFAHIQANYGSKVPVNSYVNGTCTTQYWKVPHTYQEARTFNEMVASAKADGKATYLYSEPCQFVR